MTTDTNPLLKPYNTPFGTIPFNEIEEKHFLPALKEAIQSAKDEIDQIISDPAEPDFSNTIEQLERSGELVGRIAETFFNLNSAETNDEIQQIAREFSPLLTEYSNDIILNEDLYKRVRQVYDKREELSLDDEQQMLLEKSHLGFVRNGAALGAEDKETLRNLDRELAVLSLSFGENVLAETNDFELVLKDESELEGLPQFAVQAAAELAREKGIENAWVFNLQYPSYIPFVTYSSRRDLREKMTRAFGSRAFKGNEQDNSSNVRKISELRKERARLLGFDSHAHYVLQQRMAEQPEKVISFLDDILQYAKPKALEEVDHLTAFAKERDGLVELRKWDFAYYTEKLKQELYQIDDELLKPFFQLEKVIDGAFDVAQKLYGISFVERDDIQKYHPDVVTYEVKDANGAHLAVFYADFFPRQGKRNGAWMTSFRSQKKENGENVRPHVSIVCNFTKPMESHPSLLTFQEVLTLFHEFGHSLHGILADGTYASLSGTNVYWDFVELPSQIMENWCYEKECLDHFASHYETGEKIPADLIKRLKDSSTFMEGYATVRQIGLGRLDMSWHYKSDQNGDDIGEYEKTVLKETELLPWVEGNSTSCSFSHIFQGGYSSGYYSYKWAEVLDADAFEYFKEHGIYDPEVAGKFRKLLSAGGSRHPMEVYKEFRGKEPDPKALLRRAGLLK